MAGARWDRPRPPLAAKLQAAAAALQSAVQSDLANRTNAVRAMANVVKLVEASRGKTE